MRTLVDRLEALIVWGSFFATTVYGHVAFKLAAGNTDHYNYSQAAQALVSVRGLTALLAWTLSCFLWVVVLTKDSVLAANSIASLRYVFICAAAWTFLHENVRGSHWLGILLIAIGIWILNR